MCSYYGLRITMPQVTGAPGYCDLGKRFFEAIPFLEFDMSDLFEDAVLTFMRSQSDQELAWTGI